MQTLTYAKLYDSALRSLTRRDHSTRELRDKLSRKFSGEVLLPQGAESGLGAGEGPAPFADRCSLSDALDQLLADLQEQNLLDDSRFAQAVVRSRCHRGYGPVYIRQELRKKGVNDTVLSTALEAFEHDASEEWSHDPMGEQEAGAGGSEVDQCVWTAQAALQIERRFPTAAQSRDIWLKAARFLERRGFQRDQMATVLGRMPAE